MCILYSFEESSLNYFELCIDFLDASKIVKINTIDGIHWDATQHKDFALALSETIKALNL